MENKRDLRKNEIRLNNFGSKMIIVNYNNKRDIDIYFPKYNWIFFHAQYHNFKNGNISCPYEPKIYNKGYLGEGRYKIRDENGKLTKCYNTWHSMLERCYAPKYHKKHPTYIGCEVCKKWLNFQNFAKWYYENYYVIEGERIDLDKDILIKGNKVYSPETCVFVPQRINELFTKRQNYRGKYPIGVMSYGNKNKFRVCCQNIFNKRENLGVYENKEEAFYVYKRFKEKVIKQIADEYKDKIPQKLYNAMYRYEVEIND